MIDWLHRGSSEPSITVAGRNLPLAIRRHHSAKRMVLRLSPDGAEVRVTLPKWGRTGDAVAFARSRSEWLERQVAGLPAAMPPVPGGTFRYRGTEVRIEWAADLPRKPAFKGDRITLGGPRERIENRLRQWLDGEALRLMQDDLEFYCSAAGAQLPDLALSRAKRRWGSCSSSGTVRINWRLVQAPDPIRRSVVAHEVAHLLHFDHSPAFHALLRRIYEGDLSAADRWLRAQGRTLYASFG